MTEEPMQPMESLALIDSMINKVKNRFYENGHLYLLWGWVILICSLLHFVLQYFVAYEYFYVVWLFTLMALVYQFIYLRKNHHKRSVVTYTGHIVKYVWLVFMIMMFMVIGINSYYGWRLGGAQAFILVLYGMPTFLSGIILKFPPLVRGGIFCWLLAIMSFVLLPQFHMLLFTAAVIVAWIIPGYLLKEQWRKNNSQE